MISAIPPESGNRPLGRLGRHAWLPVPLLLALIAVLWAADLRTVHESRSMMVLLNLLSTWLASLCICYLTARVFLSSGQPGLLMFGCGSMLWGSTSLVASMLIDDSSVNPAITVHNLGVFGAASCHLAGLLWRGRLPRPGPWLAAGYSGALLTAALIAWSSTKGFAPVFFVQGQGGTLFRHAVLLSAIAMFAWVAWQLISRYRRQSATFYYWYGLGLALVATGLTGVMFQSVFGGILGWTNRLTQYLGSAYLLIAALVAARETGSLTLPVTSADDAWHKFWALAEFRRQSSRRWVARYGLAIAAVAAAMGFRLALEAWFGPGLPLYMTFFPAVMVVALLAGFGPGLAATASAAFVTGTWILPPTGAFSIVSPGQRIGLVVFTGMGLFMSAIAELYRRNRGKLRDITERKQAESMLQDTLQRFYLMLSSMYSGVLLMTDEGRIEFVNQAFCDAYGLKETPADLVGLSSRDLLEKIQPSFRNPEEAAARILEILQRGEPVRVEEFTLRGGRTALRDFVPLSVQGKSCGRLWIHTDITEHKCIDEALRESEQFNKAVLDTAGSLVVVLDMEGRILRFNQACEAATGYAAAEVEGRVFWELLVPEGELEGVRRTWERLQAGDFPNSHENHWVAKDGSLQLISWRNTAIVRNGKVVYVIGAGLDITRRKRAEEQIRASLAEKDVMMREIHHRVKNNLQVITSLISLQAGNMTDERMREEFNDVRDRVRTMALVHENLYQTSNLARLNFGDYATNLLQHLWNSHGALAEKVRLNLAVSSVMLPIEAAVPCGLILNELAGNALKHAFPDGGGEVTVGMEHDAATGAICLRVADNGVGLPAGMDWRQTRSLGLRLVQLLSTQLRGTVETGPDPGTDFRITFSLKGSRS